MSKVHFIHYVSYLTAPTTSVIFKRTVSPHDIFQHRSILVFSPSIHLPSSINLLMIYQCFHSFRLDSNIIIIMSLTPRDLEILSAAFQCLRDPDAFKVGQLITMKGASCHYISLSITIPLKLCLLLRTHSISLSITIHLTVYHYSSQVVSSNPNTLISIHHHVSGAHYFACTG